MIGDRIPELGWKLAMFELGEFGEVGGAGIFCEDAAGRSGVGDWVGVANCPQLLTRLGPTGGSFTFILPRQTHLPTPVVFLRNAQQQRRH